ncbi:MAG: tetratricopeptide repeat protein [Ignavibacteriae bacterium]|nr:tetratricopeptide repeat protein [Ignavibacteriota bacterium]MCB9219252.1 tetratricopeptide repeat protein [Ignavibacteriales bacterium]MCB9260141.1 tetratricopeptide repeat protein [Ignavibacteriales bacterium]
MKIKPVFIYISLFIIVIVSLILFSNQSNSEKNANEISENSQMPNDEVHKSMMQKGSPNSGNVSNSFKQKLDDLKKFVEENPSDTSKIKEYADLLSAAHNPEKAIELYNHILTIDKNRIDILSSMAITYFNKNDFISAKKYFEEIIEVDPQNVEAQYNIGVVDARIGDINAARKQWEDLVANHPNTKMSDMAKESIEKLKK